MQQMNQSNTKRQASLPWNGKSCKLLYVTWHLHTFAVSNGTFWFLDTTSRSAIHCQSMMACFALGENPRKFRLCHTAAVNPPMETSNALGANFLNRHEVVLAEAIYNQCNLAWSWQPCGKSEKTTNKHKAGIPAVLYRLHPSSTISATLENDMAR